MEHVLQLTFYIGVLGGKPALMRVSYTLLPAASAFQPSVTNIVSIEAPIAPLPFRGVVPIPLNAQRAL